MESVINQTNILLQEVQNIYLPKYERAPNDSFAYIENEIQARIDKIISNCERLDILVNKEPLARRSNAKIRVDQLKYDCKHLQSAVRIMRNRRHQREVEEHERDALMATSFTPNDTTINVDAELQHHQQLNGAHRGMDEMLFTGSNVLSSLRNQRMTLKGAHKKMLDVANTLGLSNTVMRLIERRSTQDRYVLFIGMAVTVIIMLLVWKYLG